MCEPFRSSRKRRSRARGASAFIVEYLIVVGVLALAVSTVLATYAAPYLYKTYRKTQAAAAAPMP
jgi:hypothetical protein